MDIEHADCTKCQFCSTSDGKHFCSYGGREEIESYIDLHGDWCGEFVPVVDTATKTAEANARGEGYKADEDKPDWSLLPLSVIEDTVRVLTAGAKKYARDNWQKVPNARERYFAAALRHLAAWQRGEANDPETGLSHLAHAQCCLTFLGWLDKHGDKP